MSHPLTVPKLGLTMTDCTFIGWAKATGDKVSKGEPLYTIETDKIASEIEADADGFLETAAAPDAVVNVGDVIGFIHADKSALGGPRAPAAATAAPSQAQPAHASESLKVDVPGKRGRIMVSPVAKRIAKDAGLDLAALNGSGPGAVILRRDVEAAIALRSVPAAARRATSATVVTPAEQRRPLSGMRRAISTRMMQSLQSSAQMTGFGRIDMGEVVRLRDDYVRAEHEVGVRITYTDIMLKASATVLAEMPQINSSIIGDEIVTWGSVDIGLAVALNDGLVVPVIRSADHLTLSEIARVRAELVAKARDNRLSRDDIEGGTFSLSNFGSYGGDFETPILNPPQSALLGIGRITDEPVVRNGAIVIRPMMMMSLTFDHRLIDGSVAGRFRARLRELLEQPALWLATLR